MITYVKSQEAKLFNDAANELGIARDQLTVDEYLRRIGELYSISPRFVRLPLYEDGHEDEEIFEIDANARTITVPASFAKNGVGIVSDELAEILWFKINRYFDIKDFGLAIAGANSTNLKDDKLHILIEWEAPDGTKSASWAYAIDNETDPDYIYFGWALTGEHLTAKAGQIKFAIRILQYNADGLAYSFATQVASVAIKPTLELDLTAEDLVIEAVADKISNRIMGGQIAFCPVFVDTEVENADPIPGDLPEYLASLDNPEDAILTVKAAAPENETYDAMAYIWYKKGKDETEFSEVTDLDAGAYTPSLAITSSGQYYVVVYGMKEITDNTIYTYDATAEEGHRVSEEKEKFWYHTSVASTKSTVCEIPEPIPLEIEKVPSERIIMDPEATATVQVVLKGVQKIKNDVEVGTPGLRVERTGDATLVTDGIPEFNAEPITLAEDQVIWDRENLTLTFKTWTQVAEGEEDNTTLVDRNIDEAYYRFTVLNTLNNDTAETEQQFICRITEPAMEPRNLVLQLMTSTGTAAEAGTNASIARGNKLQVMHDTLPAAKSDGVTYEWFKRIGDIINLDENDVDPKDKPIDGASGPVYIPTVPGAYYARVTNEFNGTVSQVLTSAIVFND